MASAPGVSNWDTLRESGIAGGNGVQCRKPLDAAGQPLEAEQQLERHRQLRRRRRDETHGDLSQSARRKVAK